MKHLIYKISILGALLALGSSCGDFLDTVPDNRTEIDNVTKLGKLVASSYPRSCYAVNFNARVDYVSDKGLGRQENLSNTDAYYWRDVASVAQDSPDHFWAACYNGIAHTNEAIVAAARLGAEATEFGAEARLSRAFSHFLLVTTFAQFYDPATQNDSPGIPYVSEPEDIVIKRYDRETVAKTYERIEADLLEGIKHLGSDAKYTVPRYHFNTAAAYAFATRFYLFKGQFDKAVEYASKVIPVPTKFVANDDGSQNVAMTDPANVYALNNFQPWTTDYITSSGEELKMYYSKAENKSNLLLCEMVSSIGNYGGTWRYSMTKDDVYATYRAPHPVITDHTKESAYKLYSSSVSWYIPKFRAIFSKSSVNANSGFYYVIYPLLRNEEVLLSRAEAYVHLDQADKAIADMNIFNRTHIKSYDETKHCLTMSKIVATYKKQVTSPDCFINKYNPYQTASWSVERKSLLLFVLDTRRTEYLFEGLRYWDMWRYKMPIVHSTYDGKTNTLWPGDDRWMLQIPQESTLSGVELNPRTNLLTPEW